MINSTHLLGYNLSHLVIEFQSRMLHIHRIIPAGKVKPHLLQLLKVCSFLGLGFVLGK